MESKSLVPVIVSIIIASLVGAGISYLLLTPEIAQLQNSMDDLKTSVSSNFDSFETEIYALKVNVAELEDAYTKMELALSDIQDHVEDLQREVNLYDLVVSNVKGRIEKLENIKGHETFYVSGTGEMTTDYFEIKGDEIRVVYNFDAYPSEGWLDIQIFYKNQTLYARRMAYGMYGQLGTDIEITEPGTYYLRIEQWNLSRYTITIWDFY